MKVISRITAVALILFLLVIPQVYGATVINANSNTMIQSNKLITDYDVTMTGEGAMNYFGANYFERTTSSRGLILYQNNVSVESSSVIGEPLIISTDRAIQSDGVTNSRETALIFNMQGTVANCTEDDPEVVPVCNMIESSSRIFAAEGLRVMSTADIVSGAVPVASPSGYDAPLQLDTSIVATATDAGFSTFGNRILSMSGDTVSDMSARFTVAGEFGIQSDFSFGTIDRPDLQQFTPPDDMPLCIFA